MKDKKVVQNTDQKVVKSTAEQIKSEPLKKFFSPKDVRTPRQIKRDMKKQQKSKKGNSFLRAFGYIFFGIGDKEKVAKRNIRVPHYGHSSNSSADFRHSQSLEDYYWERERMADYFGSIDGRGDPPPPHHCDCDHDHDER